VDIVKIDRAFVGGITTNPQDRALISAVIDPARSFGLTTIAEGVESPGRSARWPRDLGGHPQRAPARDYPPH